MSDAGVAFSLGSFFERFEAHFHILAFSPIVTFRLHVSGGVVDCVTYLSARLIDRPQALIQQAK